MLYQVLGYVIVQMKRVLDLFRLVNVSSQGQGISRVKLEIIFLVLVIKLLMQYQVHKAFVSDISHQIAYLSLV
jgi:hypothetical protein